MLTGFVPNVKSTKYKLASLADNPMDLRFESSFKVSVGCIIFAFPYTDKVVIYNVYMVPSMFFCVLFCVGILYVKFIIF